MAPSRKVRAPLSAWSVAFATLVSTLVDTIHHTFVHLPRFPWRTLDAITSLHAAHPVDMNRGNHATLTVHYDWLFGTLERPVHREAPTDLPERARRTNGPTRGTPLR